MGGKSRQTLSAGIAGALADVAKVLEAHAHRAAVIGGIAVIAQPEDLIIYKAIAWRSQDQQDVERLLALYSDRIDIVRVRRHVKELGAALEVDRLGELDLMVARFVR